MCPQRGSWIALITSWLLGFLAVGGATAAGGFAGAPASPSGLIESDSGSVFDLSGAPVFYAPHALEASAVAPDGRLIVYQVRKRGGSSVLRLRRAAGGRDQTLATLPAPASATTLSWAPHDAAIAFGSWDDYRACSTRQHVSEIWLRVVSLGSGSALTVRPTAEIARILREARSTPAQLPIETEALGWSPDGRYVLYSLTGDYVSDAGDCGGGLASTLLSLDTVSATSRILARSPAAIRYAWFSPDGTQVLYLDGSWFGGQPWLVAADGSSRRRMSPARADSAAFSPDGRQVALLVRYAGQLHVIVKRIDGSRSRELLHTPVGSPTALLWTRSWHIVAQLPPLKAADPARFFVTGLSSQAQQALAGARSDYCDLRPDPGSAASLSGRSLAFVCGDSVRGSCNAIDVVDLVSSRHWHIPMPRMGGQVGCSVTLTRP
jgi:hypothetical protein